MSQRLSGSIEPALVKRIGVVVFDEDVTTEEALGLLRPADAPVSVHVSRMPLPQGSTPDALEKAAADLSAAVALLAPSERLDAVAYSCTTGALELGSERVAAAIRRSRPDVPVAMPLSGAIKGLLKLGVNKLSILTPYGDAWNALIVRGVEDAGLEVVRLGSFCLDNETDYARVSLASIKAGAHEVMTQKAEALFVSCSALRATGLIEVLEAELGVPVITSAQAMWWEALQLAGAPASIGGLGRLFER